MKSDELSKLSRSDLSAFDDDSQRLAMDMQEAGWRGRLSSKGHLLMYAPDGKTTWTFARDSQRGRSGRNARAYFQRWQKRNRGRGQA